MSSTPRPHGRAPSRIRVRIASGPDAPARARAALAPLRAVIAAERLSELELVVSELVTNAVRHSGAAPGAPVGLDVHCTGPTVRLAVEDPGDGFDPGWRRRDGPGGWGLPLVSELTDRWWVETGERTRVVAQLSVGGAAASRRSAGARRRP